MPLELDLKLQLELQVQAQVQAQAQAQLARRPARLRRRQLQRPAMRARTGPWLRAQCLLTGLLCGLPGRQTRWAPRWAQDSLLLPAHSLAHGRL